MDVWGVIDKAGKMVIPFQYDYIYPFSDGIAQADLNGKNFYLNKAGKIVNPLERYLDTAIIARYGFVRNCYNSLFLVNKGCERVDTVSNEPSPVGGKWGIIDSAGKETTGLKYDWINDFSGNFATAYRDGQWHLLDKKGNELESYENEWNYFNGRARVYRHSKLGFIDETSKEIIPPQFEDAENFTDGKAKVQMKERSFYIDKEGKEINQ